MRFDHQLHGDGFIQMNNIDFSIIIPHYNIPESLIELLETVPDKDNIEIIVVDDKSDRDLSSLEDYTGKTSASYIFLHNDTPKKGAGVCRNIGMKAARGKWLLFADSDDLFADDMYEHIKNYHIDNIEYYVALKFKEKFNGLWIRKTMTRHNTVQLWAIKHSALNYPTMKMGIKRLLCHFVKIIITE